MSPRTVALVLHSVKPAGVWPGSGGKKSKTAPTLSGRLAPAAKSAAKGRIVQEQQAAQMHFWSLPASGSALGGTCLANA